QLMDLVRKIDRDPWRVQVRDFTLWTIRQHLEHLADSVKDDESLPLIAFLAVLMNRAKADAVPMLQQAYNSHPDDPERNRQLGIIKNQRGEILQPAVFFRAVLATRPKNCMAFFRLGHCLQTLGKLDDAITAYNSAIKLDDRNGNFYLALGTVYRHKGKL